MSALCSGAGLPTGQSEWDERREQEESVRRSSSVGCALCGALVFAFVADAQRPRRPAPRTSSDDKVKVEIALQVGSDSYRFSGGAACTHEAKGEIYSLPAQQWRVEQADAGRRVALTLWRPARGAMDMFTLYLQTGGRTFAASTVKTPRDTPAWDAGEVIFGRKGAGGVFTVNATAANGTVIRGTIACEAFRIGHWWVRGSRRTDDPTPPPQPPHFFQMAPTPSSHSRLFSAGRDVG